MTHPDAKGLLRQIARMGMLLAAGLGLSGLLSGCLVAGYSTNGGFFLWPGSLGLLVIVIVFVLLMRRR